MISFFDFFYIVKKVGDLPHKNREDTHYGEFACRKVDINTIFFMRHKSYVEVINLLQHYFSITCIWLRNPSLIFVTFYALFSFQGAASSTKNT